MAVRKKSTKLEDINKEAINQELDLGADKSVENTLIGLYQLQTIYSKIDKVRVVRGELPLEVRDLEDACMGMQTRIDKFQEQIGEFEAEIQKNKENSKTSEGLIGKYKEQQNNVRNNREFDALAKEIEYETINNQLNEKKNKELTVKIAEKQADIEALTADLDAYKTDLSSKKEELNSIIEETEKDEQSLLEQAKNQEQIIEPRMLSAFTRIRENMRNGLATVKIERNACGGCFSKISPQRQLDIQMHKKIIVCEFCGRILVDDRIADRAARK